VEPGLVCGPTSGARVVTILVLCSREVREWVFGLGMQGNEQKAE